MKIPTVHLNGTGKAGLLGELEQASVALREAVDTLGHCYPNMRDYYVQPGGEVNHRVAVDEHLARLTKLGDVLRELQELRLAISDQGGR